MKNKELANTSKRPLFSTGTFAGAFGIIVFIGFGAYVSRAQAGKEKENPLTLSNVAMVDMQRIYNTSSAPRELDIKTQQIEQEAMDKLRAVASAPFLDQAELTEYSDLVGKGRVRRGHERGCVGQRALPVGEMHGIRQELFGDVVFDAFDFDFGNFLFVTPENGFDRYNFGRKFVKTARGNSAFGLPRRNVFDRALFAAFCVDT